MNTVKNPNPFSATQVEKILPLFRAATTDVQRGFKSAIRTLYDCGVTVIVESYVAKTQIRGGTFLSPTGQPYIFLTKYPNYYDTLWFALIHELHHVLFDLDFIKEGGGSHLTGDSTLFEDPLIEKEANDFAAAILLKKEMFEQADQIIGYENFIRQKAEEWNVHPAIIYGTYCYRYNDFGRFGGKNFRPSADDAIKFKYNTWQTETLKETVPLIEKELTEPMSVLN